MWNFAGTLLCLNEKRLETIPNENADRPKNGNPQFRGFRKIKTGKSKNGKSSENPKMENPLGHLWGVGTEVKRNPSPWFQITKNPALWFGYANAGRYSWRIRNAVRAWACMTLFVLCGCVCVCVFSVVDEKLQTIFSWKKKVVLVLIRAVHL